MVPSMIPDIFFILAAVKVGARVLLARFQSLPFMLMRWGMLSVLSSIGRSMNASASLMKISWRKRIDGGGRIRIGSGLRKENQEHRMEEGRCGRDLRREH